MHQILKWSYTLWKSCKKCCNIFRVSDHFGKLCIKRLRVRCHQCLLWKENLYVDLLIQKYLVRFWPHSLQLSELYYILLVLLCWIENSCSRSLHIITVFKSLILNWPTMKRMAEISFMPLNKADAQSFPPKKPCLLAGWLNFLKMPDRN